MASKEGDGVLHRHMAIDADNSGYISHREFIVYRRQNQELLHILYRIARISKEMRRP